MDYQGPTAAVRASAATAAVPASVGSSRLAQMQMRFQQRQQQERDQRKIEQIATRTTASTTTIAASSSNGRITSTKTNAATATATVTANSSATSGGGAVELADRLNATTLSSSLGAGKVRQMFDDRRHGRVAAGIDKSYPLQPIQTKTVATGAATSAGITNGNHSTGGGGGGSNNNNLAGGGVGDAGRDLGRSVVTKGATGMNNKPRVPPISATSRNRLVQQQSNRAYSLRQDVVSGMQQQQSTRSTSNAGETTTDYGGFDDNDNFLELEKHPDIAFDLDGDSVHAAANHVNNNIGGDYSLSSSNAARTATVHVHSLKLKPVPGRSAASLTATPARNSSLKKQASSITSNGSITSTATLPRSVNGSAKLGIQRAAPGSKSNGPSHGISQPSPSSSAGSLRRISSTPAPTTGMAMHATTVAHHNNDDLVPDGLTRCEICSRNFADDRIEKHRQICQKTKAKKRKVFDVTKHRVQGTDAESYVLVKGKKGATGPSRKQSSQLNGSGTQAGIGAGKQSNWRKKHEEFIATIRAAKELKAHLAKGGKLSDLPPPPPAENTDYVQCPHCSRRFNQAAADRHIPKCATMLHNKPKPKPKGAASTLRRY